MEKGTIEYIEFRRKANQRNRKYYSKKEVKEKRKEYKKRYNEINKEKIKAYGKKKRQTQEYKDRMKRWKEENKEKIKNYSSTKDAKLKKRIADKKYREKNKEKLAAIRKTQTYLSRVRKWYSTHKDHLKKVRKKYYQTEKGKHSTINCNHRRLSLLKMRETDLTSKKIKQIFERDKVCVYCGSSNKFELDHIIPLSKQGSCLFENYVLSCEKCNRSKNNRDVFEWCKIQGIQVPSIVIKLLKIQGIKN